MKLLDAIEKAGETQFERKPFLATEVLRDQMRSHKTEKRLLLGPEGHVKPSHRAKLLQYRTGAQSQLQPHQGPNGILHRHRSMHLQLVHLDNDLDRFMGEPVSEGRKDRVDRQGRRTGFA